MESVLPMPGGSIATIDQKKGNNYIELPTSSKVMEREVYPYQRQLETIRESFFSREDILKDNKTLIEKYLELQEAQGIKERRLKKNISNFTTILTIIYPGFNLKTAKEKDLLELRKLIMGSDYSINTKADFIKLIRKFYKVIEGRNARFPEKLDFFKVPETPKTTKKSEDLLTREELQKLFESSKNTRDKAIVSILHEGGLRAGELCNLDFKDVRLEENGVSIHVPDKPGSKTGSRNIFLVESYGHIRDWIESHPTKKPNGPFFTTIENHKRTNDFFRLDNYTLRNLIYRLSKRAGINGRRIHPHLFRHTCATEKVILGFNRFQLCQFMGWTPNSDQPNTYIHLSKKDNREHYLKLIGIETSNKKENKRCGKCGHGNPFLAVKCGRCFTPLDLKERLTLEDEKTRMLNTLSICMELEPELGKHIEQVKLRNENKIKELLNF